MLVPEKSIQQNLFAPVNFAKNDSLMKAVDRVNRHFGKDTIFMAGSGLKKGWSMKNEHQSKRFTTSIAELPLAR
jgi:DNA polymerase V